MKDISTGKPIEPIKTQNERLQHSEEKSQKTTKNNKETTFIEPVATEVNPKLQTDGSLSPSDTIKTSISSRAVTPTEALNFDEKTTTPPDVSLEDIPETIIMDMQSVNGSATRVVGAGGFGEVTYAVVGETEESIKKYNKKKRGIRIRGGKKISRPLSVFRILVKKIPKKRTNDFDVSENVFRFEKIDSVMQEAEKNKIAGVDSKPLVLDPAVVTVFQGVELEKLCLPDKKLAEESKPLSYLEKLCIAHQITESIAGLHDRGIAHKDLKLSNALVSAQGIIYIIDNAGITVGEPENYNYPHQLHAKTTKYCPPEVINNNKYSIYDSQGKKGSTLAHDSWSLGIMLYEIFAEKTARGFIGTTSTNKKILNYNELIDKVNQDIYLNPKVPTEIKEVIIGLLQYAPRYRLTPREVLTCDIFNNDNYKKSAFALNVQHDKNYKKLLVLEKQLEAVKQTNNLVEMKHLQEEILTTKKLLSEIKTLINNEVYRDIPKDVEFESKPLNKNLKHLANMIVLNKSIAGYKIERQAILEGIQIYKSKVEQEINDINNFGHETTEKKADLIQAKRDEFQDLEHQEFLSIESIDEYISQLKLEKQRLEAQNSGSNDNRSL
jgi:serine/threonine protein kinase